MKQFFAILALVLFSAGLYVATLRGVAGDVPASRVKNNLDQNSMALELSPERGRFAHVYALAETGRYDLTKDWAEAVYPDVGYWEGRYYSFFAPGESYMAEPFYLLGKRFGMPLVFTFGFVSLMSLLALIFMFRIGREILGLPFWAAVTACLVFAFGSTAWSYATTLYQHHLTVFFIMSGFYAAWRYRRGTPHSWVWALWVWAAYALAATIDYPNLLLYAPVALYFFLGAFGVTRSTAGLKFSLRGSFLATLVAFVAVTAWHLHVNAVNFGSPLRLSGSILGYKTIKDNNLDGKPFSEIQQTVSQLQSQKQVSKFFTEERLERSGGTLLFSRDRGLFYYAPIFLLALLGVWLAVRNLNPETATLLGLLAANLFLYSSWGDPWGGWAFGPRYLIPSMAVLSLLLAWWLSGERFGFLRRLVAFVLLAFSSAVATLGALTLLAVPPKIEADYLKTGYNFFRNLEFFRDGSSTSFVYNTYLSHRLTLDQYFLVLYGSIMLAFFILLFVLPLFGRKRHDV